MAATKIGVYYSLTTGRMTQIKIPDYDWELDNPRNLRPGEGVYILNIAAYRFFTHEALQLFADDTFTVTGLIKILGINMQRRFGHTTITGGS